MHWSWESADGPPAVWHKDNRLQKAFSALSHTNTLYVHLHVSDNNITFKSVFILRLNGLTFHFKCIEKQFRCMTVKVNQMWLQCLLACTSLSLKIYFTHKQSVVRSRKLSWSKAQILPSGIPLKSGYRIFKPNSVWH